jgi:Phospholipase_D-nuclease N-terminal
MASPSAGLLVLDLRGISRHIRGRARRTRIEGMEIKVGGFFGLVVLIADVWAIVNVFGSSASTGAKVVWTVLILLLPVLGFIIWLLAGPRAAKAGST